MLAIAREIAIARESERERERESERDRASESERVITNYIQDASHDVCLVPSLSSTRAHDVGQERAPSSITDFNQFAWLICAPPVWLICAPPVIIVWLIRAPPDAPNEIEQKQEEED